MYIKHSKFKNTGILFEILVKKITGDTLSGINSPAIKIIKEYFVNTELGKEYKLYETLFQDKRLTEQKASIILNTVLEQSKKLNRSKLKSEKYLKLTDDIVLLSIATFTLFPIHIILQNSTLI